MWCNHPFSQRSKTTERAVGMGLEATRKRGGAGQNLKKGSRQYRGDLHKIGGFKTPLPTMILPLINCFLKRL